MESQGTACRSDIPLLPGSLGNQRMIARLHRRFRENPIMFARVPRDHWLALHSLAAARQVTPNDIIREALAGVIATVDDTASLPSPGSYKSPRPYDRGSAAGSGGCRYRAGVDGYRGPCACGQTRGFAL